MADDYKEMNEFSQSFKGKQGAGIKSNKINDSFGYDRVHVIITNKKQNSWVDDLDEREKLSRVQRVFH